MLAAPVASVLLLLCLLLPTGCRTVSPTGDKVMACVEVRGHSISEIRLAALEVFQTNGYKVKSAFGRDLVFERQASMLSSLSYGAWSDPAVWLRVKLRIEELHPDVNVLECNVYRVQNRDDNILEEEAIAYEKKKKPFQQMLLQIKSRLDSGASTSTSGDPPKTAP